MPCTGRLDAAKPNPSPNQGESTPQRKAPLDSLGLRPTERVGLRNQRACLLLSGTKLLQVRVRARANPNPNLTLTLTLTLT